MKLNKEQQKLVSDNHDLIYRFLNVRRLSMDAVEDWYGAAAVGLCKAAYIYDSKSGCDFETLAYIAMNNELELVKGVGVIDFAPIFNLATKNANEALSETEARVNSLIIHKGLRVKDVSKEAGVSVGDVKSIHKRFLELVKSNACA